MQALKIVLIGYGKMGHVIEEIARARGHEIVLTIDRDESLGQRGGRISCPSCVSAVRRVRGRSFGPPTTASASSSSYRSIAV